MGQVPASSSDEPAAEPQVTDTKRAQHLAAAILARLRTWAAAITVAYCACAIRLSVA